MNEVFGLNQDAWDRWFQYRKVRRKPYKTQFGIDQAQKKLASYGDYQMEAVERCMTKEWVDLYPIPKAEIAQLKKTRDAMDLERRKLRELHERGIQIGFRAPIQGEDSIVYGMMLRRFEDQRWRERTKPSGPRSLASMLEAK